MPLPSAMQALEGYAIDARSIRWMRWAETHGFSYEEMGRRYGVSGKKIKRILAAQKPNSVIMGES